MTNQDILAESIRKMDPKKLAGYLLTISEEGSCEKCCPVPKEYCDRYFKIITTDDNKIRRLPDENGEVLKCKDIMEKWLKEEK